MRLRKKLLIVAMMAVIVASSVAYAWVTREGGVRAEESQETPSDVTKFKAVVNGMSSLDVFVCINVSDGLTEKEAEMIVGTTFILVIGDYFMHQLDTLTFDDTKIEAHYTWGYDRNDMGHVFDVTANLTTFTIMVEHCF